MSKISIPTSWIHLDNVHEYAQCQGRPCVIHNPSAHHMRFWELHWRGDRKIFERICAHGVGHPDPDQFAFWDETNQEWQAVHGCCGCCASPQAGYADSERPPLPSLVVDSTVQWEAPGGVQIPTSEEWQRAIGPGNGSAPTDLE